VSIVFINYVKITRHLSAHLEPSSGYTLFEDIKYGIVIINSRLVELQEVRICKVFLYMCGPDYTYCHVLGFFRATYKTGSGLDGWIY
jgi:hypothetical protein